MENNSSATNQSSPARLGSAAPMLFAYVWTFLFLLVYCGRPEDWIPGTAHIPFAKITAAIALVAFVIQAGQAILRPPREIIYLLLLFGQLCLTVPFSPVYRGGAFDYVLEFSKVVAIVVVMAVVANTLGRLRWLIFTQTACVLAVVIVSLVKGNLTVGRLEGASAGIYTNPNDLALAIALTVPFCFAFMLRARDVFRKAAWFLAMAVMTYTLFLTASRSGLLALVVAVGVMLREFALKGGRRHLLIPVALVALTVLLLAGGMLKKRFDAMTGPGLNSIEEGTAYGSAMARRELLWRSLVTAAQHPLFGIGPGNFPIISGSWHVAHNSFVEISAEAGLPALILFILLFRRAFQNTRKVQLLAPGESEAMLLAGALRASIVGFAVGAFFASVEYHFFPYFLVAYTSALYAITARSTSQALPAQMEALPEREGRRGGKAAEVTWDDYQKGRAAGSAGQLAER